MDQPKGFVGFLHLQQGLNCAAWRSGLSSGDMPSMHCSRTHGSVVGMCIYLCGLHDRGRRHDASGVELGTDCDQGKDGKDQTLLVLEYCYHLLAILNHCYLRNTDAFLYCVSTGTL